MGAFFVPKAYAFEYNGETYPDTLAGVTVTFNYTLTAPDSYFTGSSLGVSAFSNGTWNNVPVSVGGVSYTYTLSEGYSTTNPWYMVFSKEGNSNSAWNDGILYAGHGAFTGWRYGLQGDIRGPGPTVTFTSSQNATLLRNTGFIRYVCDNSDYFERYGSGSGVGYTPPTSYGYNSSNGKFYLELPPQPEGVTAGSRVYVASTNNVSGTLGVMIQNNNTGAYTWGVTDSVKAGDVCYLFVQFAITDSTGTSSIETWWSNPITVTSIPSTGGGDETPDEEAPWYQTILTIVDSISKILEAAIGWLPAPVKVAIAAMVAAMFAFGLAKLVLGR